MEDLKNMANVDLVRYAQEQGHNVRGMNRKAIIDFLTVKPPQSIALPDEEATLCAMRSCSNRLAVKVVGSVQTTLAPKETDGLTVEKVVELRNDLPDGDCTNTGKATWKEIRAQAKSLGISTYGKKREQVETEIKENTNGN